MVSKRFSVLVVIILTAVLISIIVHLAAEPEFIVMGKIETLGKDKTLTLLFSKKPDSPEYYIVDGETVFGTVRIITITPFISDRYRFRALVSYRVTNRKYAGLIRSGLTVALVKMTADTRRDFADAQKIKKVQYKPVIISMKDRREMVLVEAGKFYFGSNIGDRDEYPEQIVYLDNFYIDKYEVSNNDYAQFVESANAPRPQSWRNGTRGENWGRLPVLVSYVEAVAYAKWAHKRIPSEEEWEKAARGLGHDGEVKNRSIIIYPWGNRFDPERANSAPFWSKTGIGEHIKKGTGIYAQGLLPIDTFTDEGKSPSGAVNMAGNAREWTSSWYMPYRGNGVVNSKYGRQYKVIRGGAFYSSRQRVRVTSRELGGKPNLYKDDLAGFRCVKPVQPIDMMI